LKVDFNKNIMKIKKNWFYKISELEENIIIEDNLIVSIFNSLKNKNISIKIWSNSTLYYYGFSYETSNNNIKFIQEKNNSKLVVNQLLLSNTNNIKTKIYSEISNNNCSSNIEILSIVEDEWNIDLDAIIKVSKNIKKTTVKLNEDNIFLWNTWSIKGIPTLLVWSNDVKANHSCKIEKISDEKLFYLRSRWIWKQKALSIMIEAKINNLFSCISMLDKVFYNDLMKKILYYIK
jgi:Fe-S cluster assembly scaffold protein SufB